MGGSSTTTSQDIQLEPETVAALQKELSLQIGQLSPIQQQQILRYATVARNQPGVPVLGAAAPFTPGSFALLDKTVERAGERLNLSPTGLGTINEVLHAGQQQLESAAQRQATQGLGQIQSIASPQFGRSLDPTIRTTADQGIDPVTTGIAAAGAAAAIAAAVAVII